MIPAIEEYLSRKEDGGYEREAFDRYCQKRHLSLSCPVIHIAGSNGKGSTARFLEGIYRAAGYKVATFIKPQFYEVNEIISYEGKNISDADLQRIFDENRKDFEKFGLSCFEMTVAIAYRYFEERKPDIAIIECGMGGETDATNLYDLPTVLSIITSISLEHTSYLGTTISAIAYAKGGIIKDETPVLVGKVDEAASSTLRDIARDLDAPYHEVDEYHFQEIVDGHYFFDYRPFKRLEISCDVTYQLKNAALAVEATKILAERFPVSEEALRAGLKVASLPGRMEYFGRIVVDGAHNVEAVEAMVFTLRHFAAGRPVHALFACFRDKNIAAELPLLSNAGIDVTLTTFDHPRARKEEDFFIYIGDYPFEEDAKACLLNLYNQYPDDVILVCGSLHFAGLMRRFIKENRLG